MKVFQSANVNKAKVSHAANFCKSKVSLNANVYKAKVSHAANFCKSKVSHTNKGKSCSHCLSFSLFLAHLSFSDQNLSVVRRRCRCPCRRRFHLLLKNHRANFNQTWHKASLGGGRGFNIVQMKGHTLSQREIIA